MGDRQAKDFNLNLTAHCFTTTQSNITYPHSSHSSCCYARCSELTLRDCPLDRIYHARVRNRTQIAELVAFARRDLADDTTHDLCRVE
jgi:hypothetical protein